MDDLLRYKIGLTLIKGIGPVLAKNLIAYLGSVEAVFKEKPAALAKIPEIGPVLSRQIANQQVLGRADEEIDFLQKKNIRAFFYADKDYPYRLKECADAPIMLYYKGTADLNASRMIGMVGTRHATDYGKALCQSFVSELSALIPGVCIVSGLAYGIDAASHKAALSEKLPTVAALGHGLDRIYPPANRPLAIKMLEDGGGLLTEYISGVGPDKPHFVQRNRIIAGLCDAVLVVESAVKGGSLITADLAQSYNRDVFSFPGRVGDEHSAGCNALIRTNKAGLIESASDLVDAMGWEVASEKNKTVVQPALFLDLTEDEQRIVEVIRTESDGVQLNQIALQLQLPVSKISALLLTLEFNGVVRCLPGNLYRMC